MILIMQPPELNEIIQKAQQLRFTMNCDIETGQLLRTLASSKRAGTFLELGTGAGASITWILEGMDSQSRLVSVEMDDSIQSIARSIIKDERVEFVTEDGSIFIEQNKGKKFDLIFADTWPGKFYHLEEALEMVAEGGFYIIDDLNPVDSWSLGHGDKVQSLRMKMRGLHDFRIVELNWSTGLIVATRRTK
ncbi:O-methyltransferase [Paenibacillus kobensis]|uniref:O-methyltransferase n=1 Tax=Paenibacillus kobensis TaxID=59841 RepID=UPI000FDB6F47|nr:class I SAM-dependent methyltransferase [Paenibacillus kobensis]